MMRKRRFLVPWDQEGGLAGPDSQVQMDGSRYLILISSESNIFEIGDIADE